jgi:sugar lactone lactonase YvrE
LRGASLILLALTSILAAQDFTQSPIEEIATGFTGGEGPVWSRDGYLLFSDYDKDRIYKYVPGKSPEVYREGSAPAQDLEPARKLQQQSAESRLDCGDSGVFAAVAHNGKPLCNFRTNQGWHASPMTGGGKAVRSCGSRIEHHCF